MNTHGLIPSLAFLTSNRFCRYIFRARWGAVLLLLALSGCNVTSGSRIVVGASRAPIDPQNVKIYLRPPAQYEEVAMVTASSKNAFASDQSLTDSALLRMKKEAAKLGANGILLTGAGSQQIGSVGTSFGSGTTYLSGSAAAYGHGNTVTAYGSGVATSFGSGTSVQTQQFATVTNGVAIYVFRE